jgi:xylan 1,4-beta-xylosidase
MTAVNVSCDLRRPGTPLAHNWEQCIGSGHALLALRADYQAQLQRCHDELGMRRVRFHALLSDDLGTLVCEQNTLLYSFFNVDTIWDALLAMGVRPFVELSFMPSTLASGSATVFHYQGNITPPRDPAEWAALVHRLATHSIQRYGIDEVSGWFFEVWNEPNLSAFWTGTQHDYFAFYRATATALKNVSDRLRVGGPATADDQWITPFIDFCESGRVPLDFVSTHHYPTDAFGRPGDDTEAQLAASSRSVLRDRARTTRQLVGDRPLYYTEWSTSSNPRDALHDEPYAAAVIIKTMLESRGLVDGYSWWAFTDIFDENYFPSIPFHGGFGLLDLYGIEKPSYRAFELLHRLGTDLVFALEDQHPTIDAWVVRQPDGRGATVVVTNHALPRHPIATEQVHIQLDGVGPPGAVVVRRIDADHANAKARWQALGSPNYLSPAQVADLRDTSRLTPIRQPWTYEEGALHLELELPPHAVAAVTIDGGVPAASPDIARVACV